MLEKHNMFGINIHNVSMEETLNQIDEIIKFDKKASIFTPNIDFVMLSQENEEFKEIINKSDLNTIDSQPLVIVSKLLKKPFKERVSGADLIWTVSDMASQKGYSVYFLGAGPGVAEMTAVKLTERYPSLKVAGAYSPPYNFEGSEEENIRIIDQINRNNPDILFVAFGTPKQEIWIDKNKHRLNAKVSVGVGASFDFIVGKQKRAPKWLQASGLEWFYRLLHEPKRLWKRYIVRDMRFLFLLIREVMRSPKQK